MRIADEIAGFDWARIQTYLGHADMVPEALRMLATAPDEKEAVRLGRWINRILLSAAGPCEGCAPVAAVLVAALPGMTPPGHSVALELLSQLSAAKLTGPTHERIGAVDVEEIRQAVAGGFGHYVAVLRAESSPEADLYSCIDLLDVLAFHDRRLAAASVATLKAVRTAGRPTDVAVLIENAIGDLTDLLDESEY